MTTDLVVHQQQEKVVLSNEQLRYISGTEFVPAGLRGNLPAIMACVATGRAIGIDDMSALRLIHVVNGRPAFSAELMVQIVRRHGHSITGESGPGSCTVVGTRRDNGDTMTVTWTLEMAERAGLASKKTWQQYPEALLWARAVSQLSRMLFADCFAGNTYTPGEVPSDAEGFAIDDEDMAGEPKADEAIPAVGPVESPVSAAPLGAGEQPSPAITDDQKKKANVLVGTLRKSGHITNEQLWQTLRPEQEWPRDDDGELHWSPLRDSLTKDEASALIDRLERYADNLATA